MPNSKQLGATVRKVPCATFHVEYGSEIASVLATLLGFEFGEAVRSLAKFFCESTLFISGAFLSQSAFANLVIQLLDLKIKITDASFEDRYSVVRFASKSSAQKFLGADFNFVFNFF
jgi:hypothetical protein